MFFVSIVTLMIGANDVSTDINKNLEKFDKLHNCHEETVAYYASSQDEENCKQIKIASTNADND